MNVIRHFLMVRQSESSCLQSNQRPHSDYNNTNVKIFRDFTKVSLEQAQPVRLMTLYFATTYTFYQSTSYSDINIRTT